MPFHISIWHALHADLDPESLGELPYIFDAEDPRPAREQANDRYRHGGGWQPQDGWHFDKISKKATFPGDAPLKPLAITALPKTKEIVAVYPHSYVLIVHHDDSYEMARMD